MSLLEIAGINYDNIKSLGCILKITLNWYCYLDFN